MYAYLSIYVKIYSVYDIICIDIIFRETGKLFYVRYHTEWTYVLEETQGDCFGLRAERRGICLILVLGGKLCV